MPMTIGGRGPNRSVSTEPTIGLTMNIPVSGSSRTPVCTGVYPWTFSR